MSEEKQAIIELFNEDNEPEQFEHVMTLSYEENAYLIMHPVEAEDEGEVVVMAIHAEENGDESYEIVEDEDLAARVFNEFLLILEEDEADE